jgi:energy-coupling factor transporter transmembrane protein EcfT
VTEIKKSKKINKGKSQQISDYIFNFKPSNSFFNKLHPVSKILWFIIMTYLVLIQNSLILLSGIMVCIIALARLNGISFSEFLRKIRWIIMIVVFAIILNIFFNAIPSGEEEVLFYIWYPYIPIRRLAVYFAVKIGIWIISLSTCGIIFLMNTAPKDLVYGLRTLKLPYTLAFSLMVGFRYIPLIQDNTNAVIIAQKARGLEVGNAKSIKKS